MLTPPPFTIILDLALDPVWPPQQPVTLLDQREQNIAIRLEALPTGQWILTFAEAGKGELSWHLPVIELHATNVKAAFALRADYTLSFVVGGVIVISNEVQHPVYQRVSIPRAPSDQPLLWAISIDRDDRRHVDIDEALLKADDALERLRGQFTFEEVVSHWTDFLVSWRRCINKCDRIGTQADRSSWRKCALDIDADETLTFVSEARNALEHGVVQSFRLTPAESGENEPLIGGSFVAPAVLTPIEINDRQKTIRVPTSGLGITLPEPNPFQLAQIALAYAWRRRNEAIDLAGEKHHY
ncbi:hypothetical protein [Brevundimonas aurifodinae]|uniref:Uncharacterized protein n=1 Tax=Brevundimonas aurifodinae TaxID=1508312 RepID=A0ABV1NQX0_9CAUL